MIDCVSIATNHHFPEDNLLVAQHRLRHHEVIQKEQWRDIYTLDDMEFDQYDNLATEYFIARDEQGRCLGVTRSYPTTIPFMLSETFRYLIEDTLPAGPRILEASRLVLNRTLLTKEERQPLIDRLIVAYMERGLQRQIDAYIGFMLPKIWASTFLRTGWDVKWIGPEFQLPGTTDIVRAGLMPVSQAMNARIRERTQIFNPILNFGRQALPPTPQVAMYSHVRFEQKKAA